MFFICVSRWPPHQWLLINTRLYTQVCVFVCVWDSTSCQVFRQQFLLHICKSLDHIIMSISLEELWRPGPETAIPPVLTATTRRRCTQCVRNWSFGRGVAFRLDYRRLDQLYHPYCCKCAPLRHQTGLSETCIFHNNSPFFPVMTTGPNKVSAFTPEKDYINIPNPQFVMHDFMSY